MATTYKRRKKPSYQSKITLSDVKLFVCVGIFLLSVLLKYSSFDFAQSIRTQAASLVHGGADIGDVVEVFGRALGEGGVQAVFEGNDLLAEVFAPSGAREQDTLSESDGLKTPAQDTVQPALQEEPVYDTVYPESGYTEDLEDREQTLFPNEVDETVYMMDFERVTPVDAVVSSDFGIRVHPISGVSSFHYGIDYAAPEGAPIYALSAGTVRETGYGSYGNYMIVDHEDGFTTLYAHCSKLIAEKGDAVAAGQEIAQVGATGNATGNHLHLEIWRDGKALDPAHYLVDA